MKSRNIAICALLWTASMLAQTGGAITGTVVTGAGGIAVTKASVVAKNAAIGESYSAQTAANGTYSLAGLPPGAYEISVEMPPLFIPFRQNIQLKVGQTLRLDVALDDIQLNTLGDG